MKVLACIDNDLRYQDVLSALDWCLRLQEKDEVLMAHVVATVRWMPAKGTADPGWAGAERAIMEKAQDFIEGAARRFEGAKTRALLLDGDAATEIAAASAEQDVDIIVLGAFGQARSRDFLVGSFAEKILHASKRDVLLVREGGPGSADGFRALLAVDGSEASFDAVETFARKTCSDRAVIQLMHVLELPPATWDVDLNESGEPSESVPPGFKETAETALRRASEILREHGLDAETATRRGTAAAGILEGVSAFGADLVVVGAQGAGLSGPWSGSVARRVARHAPCAVLVAGSRQRSD